MRTTFIRTLHELAATDPRICLVIGDLGFGVVEEFARDYPDRFLNAGVAEQNMTGVAAGMAMTGKIVFTYSIANFTTLRCLEQIRNDVCYHRANVKVVSVGGGLAYGTLGITHHATEDLAILRALPGMAVVAPGDPVEARLATRAVVDWPGPVYLRLGKAGEPAVHRAEPDFQIGRAIVLAEGSDVNLVATGGMLHDTVRAAEALAADGISAGVISMHTVSPLDDAAVRAAATRAPLLVSIEEHSVSGGLGGAVAEVVAEMAEPHARLLRIGLPSTFHSIPGDQEYLKKQHGLDVDGLCRRIKAAVKEKHGVLS